MNEDFEPLPCPVCGGDNAPARALDEDGLGLRNGVRVLCMHCGAWTVFERAANALRVPTPLEGNAMMNDPGYAWARHEFWEAMKIASEPPPKIMRRLVKANGLTVDFDGPLTMKEIEETLGADTTDRVLLPDGVHVMIVDDLSHMKGLPLNAAATAIYWTRAPGSPHVIRGDVVIVPDDDFAPR